MKELGARTSDASSTLLGDSLMDAVKSRLLTLPLFCFGRLDLDFIASGWEVVAGEQNSREEGDLKSDLLAHKLRN